MTKADGATRLALVVGRIRRAAIAAGHGMRLSELEILLLVAGGTDTTADLVAATGGSRSNTERALSFLSGRDSCAGGVTGVRSSPFRLVEHRRHPHRRGHQWRLTPEGRGLLSHGLSHIPKSPDWT